MRKIQLIGDVPHTMTEGKFVLLLLLLLLFFGAIVEYSPHSLVLQMTALTQTKTLILLSINKTWVTALTQTKTLILMSVNKTWTQV